jgi:hypothetical protein
VEGGAPRSALSQAVCAIAICAAALADSYINAGFSQATALKTGYFFVGYPAASDSGCP